MYEDICTCTKARLRDPQITRRLFVLAAECELGLFVWPPFAAPRPSSRHTLRRRMDSGIDSTESSNGSLEEGGGAAPDVAMEGEAAPSEEANAGEAASSCGQPGLPQPQPTGEAPPAALGTQAAAPSNLRTLAAAVVSSAAPEAVENHSGSAGEEAPRDSSTLFKVVRTQLPSCAQNNCSFGHRRSYFTHNARINNFVRT